MGTPTVAPPIGLAGWERETATRMKTAIWGKRYKIFYNLGL